jgi:hypothetical protein
LSALQREAGVELALRTVSPEDYGAALELALSSGELCDLTEATPAQAYPYRELFMNAAPLFEEYAPQYVAWAREAGLWEQIEDQPGWISVFPFRIDTRRIDGGWWVRADLVGLAGDPSALFNAAAGEDGTLGLSVPGGVLGLMTQVAPLFGVPAGLYLDEQSPVYGPATPEFRNALTWLASCYASGALDPAFAVRTRESWRNLTASGRLAAAMCGFDEWEELKRNGFTMCDPPVLSEDVHLNTLSGRAVRWMTLSADCSEPEAAAGFIDDCFSVRGQLLENYGLDGVHAAVYENMAVLVEPWKSAGLATLRREGLLSQAMPGIFFAEENALSPALRDKALALRTYLFSGETVWEEPALRGEEAEDRLLVEGNLWPTAQRWWTGFIMGTYDPVADWDQYLQALEQAGLSEWIG